MGEQKEVQNLSSLRKKFHTIVHKIFLFSACEPTRDYAYFKKSAPNDFIIEDAVMPAGVTFQKMAWKDGWSNQHGWVYRGDPVNNPRKCAVFCASVPNCVAWSSAVQAPHPTLYPEGCKIFSSKAGYSTDVEVWNENNNNLRMSKFNTPFWMSGERGCYGIGELQKECLDLRFIPNQVFFYQITSFLIQIF